MQRVSVQSAVGGCFTFDFERMANQTPIGAIADDKRWDPLALSFLKHLSKKKALALVMAMQNQEGVVGKIGLKDLFKSADPIDVFDVCVADQEANKVNDSEELLAVDSELVEKGELFLEKGQMQAGPKEPDQHAGGLEGTENGGGRQGGRRRGLWVSSGSAD